MEILQISWAYCYAAYGDSQLYYPVESLIDSQKHLSYCYHDWQGEMHDLLGETVD